MKRCKIVLVASMLSMFITQSVTAQYYPHTDPTNEDGWILNTDISDEFEDGTVDEAKWLLQGRDDEYKSNWIGRAPSQFVPENISQGDGMLKIHTKWEPEFDFHPTPDKTGQAYENITTGAVISREAFLYGYMEICCKVPDASMTGAFWGTGDGFELDVFEHMGRPSLPNKEHLETEMWSSIHDWSMGGTSVWTQRDQIGFRVAGDFHTYSCEWDPEFLKFYADGELVRTLTKQQVIESAAEKLPGSRGWVVDKPMYVWMDSETFPWHGLPAEADLPVDYEIKYIRVWQKNFIDGPRPAESVVMSNPELHMSMGQQGALSAEVLPSDAADRTFAWASSNTSIATINKAGYITPKAVGEVDITATSTDGNHSATTRVYITALRDSNLLVDGGFENGNLDAWSDNSGEIAVVAANASYTGSWMLNIAGDGIINQQVQLLPNTTYTLSAKGQIESGANYFIIGAAEFGFKNKSASFKNKTNPTEMKCHFTTGPSATEARIFAWSGMDACVGTLDNMKLIGGTADRVVTTFPVTGVNIAATELEVVQGESIRVSAEVLPSYATNKTLMWSSEDEDIATVNAGSVTGVAIGETTITVTTADGGFEDQVTINVIENPALNYVTYEAEDRTDETGSCQPKEQWTGFTGTGYMSYASAGAWLEWDNVIGAEDSCELIFTYTAMKGDREMEIYINNVLDTTLNFTATSSWSDYQVVSYVAKLNEGANVVKVLRKTDAVGGLNLDKMQVNVLVNVSTDAEQESTFEITLSPNPTRGLVSLEVDQKADVRIYNAAGLVVRECVAEVGDNNYDLTALPSGVYFVQISTATQTLCKTLNIID